MIDILPGGEGDYLSPVSVNPQELYRGIQVEMEHTNNPLIAQEIALDHLFEDSRYYTKLLQVHMDGLGVRIKTPVSYHITTNPVNGVDGFPGPHIKYSPGYPQSYSSNTLF
jgi:hypothetical protein